MARRLFDLPSLQSLLSTPSLHSMPLVYVPQPNDGHPQPLGADADSPPLYLVNPSALNEHTFSFRISRYSYCSPNSNRSSSAVSRFRTLYRTPLRPEMSAWLERGKLRGVVEGAEDMRIFRLHGRVHAVFNRQVVSSPPTRCCQKPNDSANVMFVAQLEPEYKEVPLVYNESRRVEKNWAPFVVERELYMIYSLCPLVILLCDSQLSLPSAGHCTRAFESRHEACEHLKGVRGGSPLLRKHGQFLGVAHRSWGRWSNPAFSEQSNLGTTSPTVPPTSRSGSDRGRR